MKSQTKPMAVKLSLLESERLNKLGEKKKRSAHWLAKEAISQYLDREESTERFKQQETIDRWEEYLVTGKTVADDAVQAWLDSWGTVNEHETPSVSE